METEEVHKQDNIQLHRFQSLLFPFAYNITGDSMAAEDIVQEVLAHHLTGETDHIKNPEGYLIKSVVNKSINQKNLLRTRKEHYPGHWLPTPVLTEESIYKAADRDKIIQYSLLVLMEQLNAKERAVFILKETFDFTHEEISDALKITVDHSRQLLKRSKEKVHVKNNATKTTTRDDRKLITELSQAILSADIDATKALLSNDIQCISDGGPNVSATRNMLEGPDRVSKLLKAIYGKYFSPGTTTEFAIVNHYPALLFNLDGVLVRCVVFDIDGDLIRKIFVIVNPDKLKKLNYF